MSTSSEKFVTVDHVSALGAACVALRRALSSLLPALIRIANQDLLLFSLAFGRPAAACDPSTFVRTLSSYLHIRSRSRASASLAAPLRTDVQDIGELGLVRRAGRERGCACVRLGCSDCIATCAAQHSAAQRRAERAPFAHTSKQTRTRKPADRRERRRQVVGAAALHRRRV